MWRAVWTLGIVGGLGWLVAQPYWHIAKPEQIQIEGNRYLTDTAIRSRLGIAYPTAILQLSPSNMSERAIASGSIAQVQIDRSLLPPRLVVRVRDLLPVAGAIGDDPTQPQNFLDENGRQLPLSSYRSTVVKLLPKLRVRLPVQGDCPNWSLLYRAVKSSPVAIGIVDCRQPHDIMLQTEVGTVRLGAATDKHRLASQLQQLDSLRNWQQHTPTDLLGRTLRERVMYLDLEHPDRPKLQLKPEAN